MYSIFKESYIQFVYLLALFLPSLPCDVFCQVVAPDPSIETGLRIKNVVMLPQWGVLFPSSQYIPRRAPLNERILYRSEAQAAGKQS